MSKSQRDILTGFMANPVPRAVQAVADETAARDRIVRAAIAEVNVRSENLIAVILGDMDRESRRRRWERIKAATDELRNAVGDYQEEFGD